jgi:hypothetical protein
VKLESLRDHHRKQNVYLSEERRLEENLVSERVVRQKLERTLEDVEKQLGLAKQMESFCFREGEVGG